MSNNLATILASLSEEIQLLSSKGKYILNMKFFDMVMCLTALQTLAKG